MFTLPAGPDAEPAPMTDARTDARTDAKPAARVGSQESEDV
jgi:hypothetical protein